MCVIVEVMCPTSKTNSKGASKRKCRECAARKAARDEINRMYQNQFGFDYSNGYGYQYSYNYGYGNWTPQEDWYPAMVSRKQWGDHTQTAQNAYNAVQENGKKIGEVKSAITSDIRDLQKAIEETRASIDNVQLYAQGTREAVDSAHASIRDTQLAVQEAQLAIQQTKGAMHDKHIEQMDRQEECAAGIVRVRGLLEEEAKKREGARVEQMHQEQVENAKPQPDKDYHSRLSRTEMDIELLRQRDIHFHHPRFQRPCFDDVIEPPPPEPSPHVKHLRSGRGQPLRRPWPRYMSTDAEVWDY